MPKTTITLSVDEMLYPDFQRDLVIATAKALHEIYCGMGPCPRRANIEVLSGTAKYVFISVDEFLLGAHHFCRENGEWKVYLYGRDNYQTR